MTKELTKKFGFWKSFFISFSVASLTVALFFSVAIAFYPGGNFKFKDQEGFSFLWGAMTDLGSPVSINGEPNPISQIFYRIGITTISLIVMSLFAVMWIFFQERKSTKILSIIGTVLGTLQGIAFLGVGYTFAGDIHMTFLVTAPLVEFFAILFYAIVFTIDKRVPKISRYLFWIMFALALSYVAFVIIGLFVGGDFEMIIRHAGHTVFNFCVITGYAIFGIGMYMFVREQEQVIEN
jgi:hypothetical protein